MEIRATYTVPFSQDQVYQAWISSDTVIPPATGMDILAEIGGHYRLLMQTDEYTLRNEGEFIDVQPNSFLHYTWEWNNDGEVSHIEVTFNTVPGGTQIEIYHYGFTQQESVDNHKTGWDSYVEGLIKHMNQIYPPGT